MEFNDPMDVLSFYQLDPQWVRRLKRCCASSKSKRSWIRSLLMMVNVMLNVMVNVMLNAGRNGL